MERKLGAITAEGRMIKNGVGVDSYLNGGGVYRLLESLIPNGFNGRCRIHIEIVELVEEDDEEPGAES